jgi:hypothetical protein
MAGYETTHWDSPVLCIIEVQIIAVLGRRRYGYNQLVSSMLETSSFECVGLISEADWVAFIGSVPVLFSWPVVEDEVAQRGYVLWARLN